MWTQFAKLHTFVLLHHMHIIEMRQLRKGVYCD